MLDAVVFDVDGTLADTERDGHRPAFNRAFADAGLPYRWDVDTYGRLLAVTGGARRLEGYLREVGHPDAAASATALHRAKTAHLVAWVRAGPVRCRPGVDVLVAGLVRSGVRCAVATTGRRAWVQPLLHRLFDAPTFDPVVTGDDVAELKPAPDAYLRAVDRLGVDPARVLAVEDSANGLRSARAAGLACVVVTNAYTRGQDLTGAAAVLDGFAGLDAARCAALVARSGQGVALRGPARGR